jgi:hypothetical protein
MAHQPALRGARIVGAEAVVVLDRLSVEEISRRLEKLSSREITKLKAYEERHKKHSSLLERFDRALV